LVGRGKATSPFHWGVGSTIWDKFYRPYRASSSYYTQEDQFKSLVPGRVEEPRNLQSGRGKVKKFKLVG